MNSAMAQNSDIFCFPPAKTIQLFVHEQTTMHVVDTMVFMSSGEGPKSN